MMVGGALIVAGFVVAGAIAWARHDTSTAARFERPAGYRFTTMVTDEQTPPRLQPDGARMEGTVDVVHRITSMTVSDPNGRHSSNHYIQTPGAQYTRVADWRQQQLSTNARQDRLLAGKHWVRDKRAGTNAASIDVLFVDPPLVAQDNVVAQLRAARLHLVSLGSERVRGAETQHYRLRSDTPVRYNTGTRTTRRTVDLWVNASGRLVRLRTRTDTPDTDDSAPTRVDSTTDYTYLAHAPAITVPPAGDTADGARLAATR